MIITGIPASTSLSPAGVALTLFYPLGDHTTTVERCIFESHSTKCVAAYSASAEGGTVRTLRCPEAQPRQKASWQLAASCGDRRVLTVCV